MANQLDEVRGSYGTPLQGMGQTISIIGSFRQHYRDVLEAWLEFHHVGWTVTSPIGSPVIEEGIPFVRFETDEPTWDDPTVQTVALHTEFYVPA